MSPWARFPEASPLADISTSHGTVRVMGDGRDILILHPDGRTGCTLAPSALSAFAAFLLGVVCELEGEDAELILHDCRDGDNLTATVSQYGQEIALTWSSMFRDDMPTLDVDARGLGSAVANAIAHYPPSYVLLDGVAPSSSDI